MRHVRFVFPVLSSALLAALVLPVAAAAQSSPAPCAAPAVVEPAVVAVPGGDAGNSVPQPGPMPAAVPGVCWTGAIGNPLNGSAIGATGDLVLAGSDTGALVAFATDGTERWRFQADESAMAVRSLALSTDTAYVATPTGIVSLALADGSEGWRFDIPTPEGMYIADTVGAFWAVLSGTTLIATVHTSPEPMVFERTLVVLDATTGATLWSVALPPDGQIGRPATNGDIVALVAGFDVQAFDLATGTPAWTADYETIGNTVTTDLAFAADLVLMGLADRSVAALSVTDGTTAWHSSAIDGSSAPLGLAAAGDIAYLNTGLQLVAIDTLTGATPWGVTLQQTDAMFTFRATPAIVDGGVVVGTTDAMDIASLVAISDTGTELWRAPTEIYGAIIAPVVLGGRVYASTFGMMSGGLLAFGAP